MAARKRAGWPAGLAAGMSGAPITLHGWCSTGQTLPDRADQDRETPRPGRSRSRGILPLGCLYHLLRPGLADTDSLPELGKAQPARFLYADRELETDRPRLDGGLPQRLHEPACLSKRGLITRGALDLGQRVGNDLCDPISRFAERLTAACTAVGTADHWPIVDRTAQFARAGVLPPAVPYQGGRGGARERFDVSARREDSR